MNKQSEKNLSLSYEPKISPIASDVKQLSWQNFIDLCDVISDVPGKAI
jgi:hypothetical protein